MPATELPMETLNRRLNEGAGERAKLFDALVSGGLLPPNQPLEFERYHYGYDWFVKSVMQVEQGFRVFLGKANWGEMASSDSIQFDAQGALRPSDMNRFQLLQYEQLLAYLHSSLSKAISIAVIEGRVTLAAVPGAEQPPAIPDDSWPSSY